MSATDQRKLLILDLDETLIHAREHAGGLTDPPDFALLGYLVWKRPFLDAFIAQVQEWYRLALWTASSPEYAAAMVRQLFPEPNQLAFVWARDRCTRRIDPDRNLFYWQKNLNKLKRQKRYRLEKLLMLDDSPEKLERHYGNLISIKPFEGQSDDSELRDLLPYLAWLRHAENVRTIEKRYWRDFEVSTRE
jgi:TFIIF-interacting CTD phosphatase-like protein